MAPRDREPDAFDFLVAALFRIREGVVHAFRSILKIDDFSFANASRGAFANTEQANLAITPALGHHGANLGGSDFQTDMDFFLSHQFFRLVFEIASLFLLTLGGKAAMTNLTGVFFVTMRFTESSSRPVSRQCSRRRWSLSICW